MNGPNYGRGAPYDFDFSGYDPQDIRRNRVVSMLAYFGFLFFLPLVVCPESRFGRFHANQGLVLLLFIVAGHWAFRFVRLFGWLFGGAYSLLMLILIIIGMVNAYSGRAVPLPIIGGIRIIR